MPLGTVIGKVAVKVLPDTSDFRDDAKRKLERIEKGLKVKVDATFNPTGLKREILTHLRALNAELATNDRYKVKFRAGISNVGMQGELRDALRELKAQARAMDKVQFKVDVAAGVTEVELDQNSLRRVHKELEHWRDQISPLKIAVTPDLVNGTSAAVAGRLRVLTRPRTVDIIPKLNKGAVASVGTALAALSGARLLNETLDGLWSRIKNLDKSVPLIATMAEAIAGLGAFGLTAASNLFAVSSALAQIGGAGLALAGIFGGLLIGAGATIAVFKDFNKVIPELGDRLHKLQDQMSNNFWAVAEKPIRHMIDSLFPELASSLKKTATELGGFFGNLATSLETALGPVLKSMFDDLNKSIDIASKHTDDFAGVIKTLGTVGAGQLPRLAKWFGDISHSFNEWLSEADADGRLQKWIDNGIEQLGHLGDVAAGVGRIVAGIARAAEAAGGAGLEQLADALDRIQRTVNGQAFQKGLTTALKAAHDAMTEIADRSGPAFSSFLETLASKTPAIFGSMGRAVGTALDAIFDALAQPAVMTGLVQMFSGLEQAISYLAPAMKPLGKALGAVMSLIGTMAHSFAPALSKALSAVSDAVTVIAPALEPVIEILGGAFTKVIEGLAPLLGKFAEGAAGLFEKLAPVLEELFKTMGPSLKELGDALGEFIPKFFEAFGPVAADLLLALIPLLPPLVKAITGILEALIPLLPQMAEFLRLILEVAAVVGPVAALISEAFVGAFSGIAQALGGVLTAISGFVRLVGALFTGDWRGVMSSLGQITAGGLNFVAGLFRTLWNGGVLSIFRLGTRAITAVARAAFGALPGPVRSALSTIGNICRTTLALIPGLFRSALSQAQSVATSLWNGIASRFRSGAQSAKEKVLTIIRSIPGAMRSAMGNAGDILSSVGSAIMGGLIGKIESGIRTVRSKLQGLTAMIPDWKGPLPRDRKLLYGAGVAIIQGLVKGLTSQFGNVRYRLAQLTALLARSGNAGLKNLTANSRALLAKDLKTWQGYATQIAALQKKVADMKAYSAKVRDDVIKGGSIANVEGGSFRGIIASLTKARDRAILFGETLKTLKGLGLNRTAFDQLAQAGPEAALAAAQNMAKAGKAGVDQVNKLQAELIKAAGTVGNVAAEGAYGMGFDIAAGLIKGLQSKQKALEKEMERIARALVKVFRRALGIKSPSRVFKQLGAYVGQGFINGVEGLHDKSNRAIEGLAVARPDVSSRLSSAVSTAGAVAATSNTKVINYYAAPGSSLGSEEDLFGALDRARSKSF